MVEKRFILLIGLFALSAWAVYSMAPARPGDAARWPTDDSVYGVDGWTLGPLKASSANGVTYVSRTYSARDTVLTMTISTSPEAKRIYRAGAEVPYLGSGFVLDPGTAAQLVPGAAGRGTLLARRGDEAWLDLHAFGERRGLLGNGLVGWTAAVIDGALDQPNDYFLARVVGQVDAANSNVAAAAASIADEVFPRLAAWYAANTAR